MRICTVGVATANRPGAASCQSSDPGEFGQTGGIASQRGSGDLSRGIDEATLKRIASTTGGAYYTASSAAEQGIVLIFDEVMTGFRVHRGGAQALYDIQPDLTLLGKVIGGGLPVGAYGGRRDIMQMVAPAGPVYQAGTLSGNPLAMSAGIAALNIISDEAVWAEMEARGQQLQAGIEAAAKKAGVPIQQTRVGTMFATFFTETEPRDWA